MKLSKKLNDCFEYFYYSDYLPFEIRSDCGDKILKFFQQKGIPVEALSGGKIYCLDTGFMPYPFGIYIAGKKIMFSISPLTNAIRFTKSASDLFIVYDPSMLSFESFYNEKLKSFFEK